MTRKISPVPSSSDCIHESLSIPAVCQIEFPDSAVDGTTVYLLRLCGIARRVIGAQTVLGQRYRVQGDILIGRGPYRWAARSFIAPPELADAVQACFAEHPPRSTRDQVTVHFDFDIWARKRPALALGYELVCQGRAYVPEPLSALAALSFSRPVPTLPPDPTE